MGTREVTNKESGAAQKRLIFFLIVYLHLVASQQSDDEATAETPPCPPTSPPNSCPNHLATQLLDAITTCAPSKVLAPPSPAPADDDGGDLHPVTDMMGDQELSTATLTEAVVLALLTSRKDDGTQWEIMFILIFPSAVCALFFFDIPLRNMHPRFAQVLEQLLVIFFVNGLMAFLLPSVWFWVPAVCFGSSLLILIVAPWLP